MAQLVARAVRDCEVASSNLVAQTTQGGKIEKIYFLYLNDAEWKGFAKQKLTTCFSGLSAVVARTSGGREVASSILVAPTIHLNSDLEIFRLLL